MLPAVSLEDILAQANLMGTPDPLGERLVSIVFANPRSPVWDAVHTNRAYLDARSGEKWDLFFAGMSRWLPMPGGAAEELGVPTWNSEGMRYFNPRAFNNLVHQVQEQQERALQHAHRPLDEVWRFSGETDLVSFMVYQGEPDWLTTCDICIYDGEGHAVSLESLTERFGDWQSSGLGPETLVADLHDTADVDSALARSLQASAYAVAGGMIANLVYDLLRNTLR